MGSTETVHRPEKCARRGTGSVKFGLSVQIGRDFKFKNLKMKKLKLSLAPVGTITGKIMVPLKEKQNLKIK